MYGGHFRVKVPFFEFWGFGPRPLWRRPRREAYLRMLEEYKRGLEEELKEVEEEIEGLKKEMEK